MDETRRARRRLALERRVLEGRLRYLAQHGLDPTMDRQTAARLEAVSAADAEVERLRRRQRFLADVPPNEIRMTASLHRRPRRPVARRPRVARRGHECRRSRAGTSRRPRRGRAPPSDPDDPEPAGASPQPGRRDIAGVAP
jgi:hypothetical protein